METQRDCAESDPLTYQIDPENQASSDHDTHDDDDNILLMQKKEPNKVDTTNYESTDLHRSTGYDPKDLANIVQQKKYPQPVNYKDSCWIDVVLALLWHCQSLKESYCSSKNPGNIITIILEAYRDGKDLYKVQTIVFDIVQKQLRCERNKPGSPYYLLDVLLRHDTEDKFIMDVSYEYQCKVCQERQDHIMVKCGIRICDVKAELSNLSQILSHEECPNCRLPVLCKLTPISLSDCVLFHFLKCLPQNIFDQPWFDHGSVRYDLTAIIQVKRAEQVNHFIAWVRKAPELNSWMECDDNKGPTTSFRDGTPNIPPNETYILLFEKRIKKQTEGHDHTKKRIVVDLDGEDQTPYGKPLNQEKFTSSCPVSNGPTLAQATASPEASLNVLYKYVTNDGKHLLVPEHRSDTQVQPTYPVTTNMGICLVSNGPTLAQTTASPEASGTASGYHSDSIDIPNGYSVQDSRNKKCSGTVQDSIYPREEESMDWSDSQLN